MMLWGQGRGLTNLRDLALSQGLEEVFVVLLCGSKLLSLKLVGSGAWTIKDGLYGVTKRWLV